MRLTVVPFPPYRAELGSAPFEIMVADGASLREVLLELGRRSPSFTHFASAKHDEWLLGHVMVHVRGELVFLDESLHDGERLELLPPISGGSS